MCDAICIWKAHSHLLRIINTNYNVAASVLAHRET